MPGRRLHVTRLAALAVLAAAVWSAVTHPWGWLYAFGVHPYPESSSTPWSYQLWSGLVPALTVLSVFGAAIGAYRTVNCKWDRCPRIGHFPDARNVRWCWRHHPDHKGQRPDGEMLHRLHFEHLDKISGQPGRRAH